MAESELQKNGNTERGTFDLDTVLSTLGGCGKFQIIALSKISLIFILTGMTDFGFMFTTSKITQRCLVKECESVGSSYEQPWLSSAIPNTEEGDYSICEKYKQNISSVQECGNSSFSSEVEECDDYIYATEERTIFREDWGVACKSQRWMASLVGSLNCAGAVLSTLFIGNLADRFGRKTVLVTFGSIVTTMGILKSFSTGYIMFAVVEFLQTTAGGGLSAIVFIFIVELVEPSKRLRAAFFTAMAYPVGETIVSAVQWLTFDWRTTLRVLYGPYILALIILWTLPESARWLHTKHRKEEMLEVLQKVASVNGTILTKEHADKVMAPSSEKKVNQSIDQLPLTSIWKSTIMRKRVGAAFMLWIATTPTFAGLTLSAVTIHENKFLDSILVSCVEFPSGLLTIWLMDLRLIGRRYTLIAAYSACALACIAFAYIPDELYLERLLIFLCGKLSISVALFGLNTFTAELFPTNVRGRICAFGHLAGRTVAIAAPQVPLLAAYYSPAPLLTFSLITAIGALVTFSLPETLGTKLPDTVAEAELLGRKKARANGDCTYTNKSYIA